MLARYKQQVIEAEGRRQQAEARLASATDRWQFHKKHFFANPVNLLLPFTAGALLASRGSATRQMVGWSRALFTGTKLLMAVYPLVRTVKKTADKAVESNSQNVPERTDDTAADIIT